MGQMEWDEPGKKNKFIPGPMAVIVDRLCEQRLEYSLLELAESGADTVQYVAKAELRRDISRPQRFPRHGQSRNAIYHYESARILGMLAQKEVPKGPVIAVLFRDADGTQTTPAAAFDEKFQSIKKGFLAADFECGVPMVPQPKSEAWMLCALKSNPYHGCDELENASGNDASHHALKKMLKTAMQGEEPTAEAQATAVRDGRVDPFRITMPSFKSFRTALDEALALVLPGSGPAA